MTERKPGRPKTKQVNISSESIISKAIDILSEKGIEQLSMRQIAKEMSITPMAIYHYFSDKNALIEAIADALYKDIKLSEGIDARQNIASLLLNYREKVIHYPQITLAIFNPSMNLPKQAQNITDILIQQLIQLGLSENQAIKWGYMLIDYTHGEALSVHSNHHSSEKIKLARLNYHEMIKLLLENIS
ncbi:TetR/AcrR family transcriptional regulator [Providencia sp.]